MGVGFDSRLFYQDSKTGRSDGLKRQGSSSKLTLSPRRDTKNVSLESHFENLKGKSNTGSRNSWSLEDKVRLFGLLESIKSELRNMNKLFRKKFGD
jgi:hypothetical protein